MVFHPRGIAAYTINEKDSTVDTFMYLSGAYNHYPVLPAIYNYKSY